MQSIFEGKGTCHPSLRLVGVSCREVVHLPALGGLDQYLTDLVHMAFLFQVPIVDQARRRTRITWSPTSVADCLGRFWRESPSDGGPPQVPHGRRRQFFSKPRCLRHNESGTRSVYALISCGYKHSKDPIDVALELWSTLLSYLLVLPLTFYFLLYLPGSAKIHESRIGSWIVRYWSRIDPGIDPD